MEWLSQHSSLSSHWGEGKNFVKTLLRKGKQSWRLTVYYWWMLTNLEFVLLSRVGCRVCERWYSVQEPDPESFYLWKINMIILDRSSTCGVNKYGIRYWNWNTFKQFHWRFSHSCGKCYISENPGLLLFAVQYSLATFPLGSTVC